jgi:hypothetical protein
MSEVEDYHYAESPQSSAQAGGGDEAARAPNMLRASRIPPFSVANPDDPPVQQPPQGSHGPLVGPLELGTPGRIAIVQGQVFLVGAILVVQLWLITDALYSLLSGRLEDLGWLALASGLGFVIALVVWLWPRRRIQD